MCAIFGFLDYMGKVDIKVLKKLIKALSVEAEVRGTDATGISYVRDGKIVTFKKGKAAHKVNLYFPTGTRTVIGHTRMTTQGDAKHNYNNHPFEGQCGNTNFALAHNGIIYNDSELQKDLPKTKIETDSYVAVQLLEQQSALNTESIKAMSEKVTGSFVFTILRNDNTLYLVRGNNPITLYRFPKYGIYIYASTKSILDSALKDVGFVGKKVEILISEGEILEISPDGKTSKTEFEVTERYYSLLSHYGCFSREYANWYDDDEANELLLEYCGLFGVSEEDVELLLEFGYDADTIEDMLMDTTALDEALTEIRQSFCV